jgi:hypothetical protein
MLPDPMLPDPYGNILTELSVRPQRIGLSATSYQTADGQVTTESL